MKETKILPAKHVCGQKFGLRIIGVEDNYGQDSAWIVCGVCKCCQTIMMLDLFRQAEEPLAGVDYVIDKKRTSEKGHVLRPRG